MFLCLAAARPPFPYWEAGVGPNSKGSPLVSQVAELLQVHPVWRCLRVQSFRHDKRVENNSFVVIGKRQYNT